MLGILTTLAVLQVSATMSAEEIRARLEAPITFETGPVRLPVALEELGNSVGIRIRCDSELQPAVVAVFAKNQPAKDILKRLLDGISAGSSIYQGTLQVGMGIASPELEAKRLAGAKASIQQWIDNRGKTAQIDKPLDSAYFARLGALALIFLQGQGSESGYRAPHPEIYQSAMRSPLGRLFARSLAAVGPEALLQNPDKLAVISSKNLEQDQAAKVEKGLAEFIEEQSQSSAAMSDVWKVLNRGWEAYLPGSVVGAAEPLGDRKPDSIRIELLPDRWNRVITFQVLSGGQVIEEQQDYLGRQRAYIAPPGEPYDLSKANNIKVQ
jgi:hypothetical protein